MTQSQAFSRRHALLAAAGLAAIGLPGIAAAQSGTVKFILPNATGSGVDAITRAAQPALGKVPATNAKEFIALLKSKPGQLNFASGGNGTILHLATELFLDESGTTAKHIPYKGVGPMVTDMIGGQVEFGTAALPSLQAHIKSGALRAIGTLTAQRVPAAPEIPTFAEQGLPNFVLDAWFAVIGPKGLSAANVKKVHDAVVT